MLSTKLSCLLPSYWGWGPQLCLPNLLHMVLYETLRLAHGPDLVSLDLAPFFGVPASPSRSCLQARTRVLHRVAGGKAVLGMG